MLSTKEPQWIDVNNHALVYFGGVPALVVCDNCKQAVVVNQDWIEPELNKDYADWVYIPFQAGSSAIVRLIHLAI